MEIVTVSKLKPGDKLARSIYGSNGQLLLARGAVLTAREIERLDQLGVPAIYVDSGDPHVVIVDEVVREETRVEATRVLHHAYEELSNSSVLRVREVFMACEGILDEVMRAGQPVIQMVDIRTLDDFLLGHSVGVCILSLLLGRRMGLKYGELKDLGMGALLHDVGRVSVSPSTWMKPGPLTAEEWASVRSHARAGFDLLKRLQEVRVLSAHVAFQHHERLSGSGYPRGLEGDDIHIFARIAAVADVYDALTHGRSYRPAIAPHHVLSYLKSYADREFDAAVVNALVRTVAPYPVGTRVLLSDGRTGVVELVNGRNLEQPIVRFGGGERVDLAEAGLRVERVLSGWGAQEYIAASGEEAGA